MGTLTFWNPLGHSRPVTGLLYLSLQELVEEGVGLMNLDQVGTGDDLF